MAERNNGNVLKGYGLVDAALGSDEGILFEMYEHLAPLGEVRPTELMVVGAILAARHPELSQANALQA